MTQVEEENALNGALETDGNEEIRRRFISFLKTIDPSELARQIGVTETNRKRFATEYRAALWFYHQNFRKAKSLPPRQESIRELNRIAKTAATLNKLLKEAYQEESEVWWFIDEAYMSNETEALFANMPSEYEGLTLGECEMEKMIEGTAFLAEMIDEAERILPKRGRGKPKANAAAEAFVRRLAVIFEEHSRKAASACNYWNSVSGLYEGKFTIFVEFTIGLFPNKHPLTNNAIGEIIRRALGSR